jgi:hypothetical protein
MPFSFLNLNSQPTLYLSNNTISRIPQSCETFPLSKVKWAKPTFDHGSLLFGKLFIHEKQLVLDNMIKGSSMKWWQTERFTDWLFLIKFAIYGDVIECTVCFSWLETTGSSRTEVHQKLLTLPWTALTLKGIVSRDWERLQLVLLNRK